VPRSIVVRERRRGNDVVVTYGLPPSRYGAGAIVDPGPLIIHVPPQRRR
jgi:hypothetical protein